jgi:hypothetical protein
LLLNGLLVVPPGTSNKDNKHDETVVKSREETCGESTEFGKSVIRCMRKLWTRAEKRATESRVEWKNCEIRQCLGDDASTC